MTKAEVGEILVYLLADFGEQVSKPKVDVWFDQLQTVPQSHAWTVARVMLGRKTYGVPKVQDFMETYKDMLVSARGETWAEAWDCWVKLARRYGYHNQAQAMDEYEKECPLGYRALGTLAREWFDIKSEDIPTFRAQFRQRYESLNTRDERMLLPGNLKEEMEKIGFTSRDVSNNGSARTQISQRADSGRQGQGGLEKSGGAALLLLRKTGVPQES